MERLEQILTQQARRSPDREAAVCGDARITYGELDRASEALAGNLARAGVGPGERVGLWAAKGIPSLVGLYAALKANAAYVPLDPFDPLGRSAGIISRCRPRVLLVGLPQLRKLQAAETALQGVDLARIIVLSDRKEEQDPAPLDLPGAAEVEIFSLPGVLAETDGAGKGQTPGQEEPRGPRGQPDDPAYILFTSGSTGVPRGVTISHRASLSFVSWAARFVGLAAKDRCSNHAPLYFDLSVFDIFSTMMAGGTVVIIPPAMSAFARSLGAYLEQQRITVWYSVPSTLVDLLLFGELGRRDLSCLRAILFAGEVFPVGQLRALMHTLPHCTFYNLYGPTETNVCTAFRLAGPPDEQAREIPIGHVCEGLQGQVVDTRGAMIEGPGEGELVISGPTVMAGYWEMPEETARTMVTLPDRRTYHRTGDLVRRDPEGLLWFLGRKDAMVKVAGYRIELAEVEAALVSLPGVLEACALTAPGPQGQSRLFAFVAGKEPGPAGERIISDLQELLPRYMLPSRIVTLPRLPRTPTGKIDRQALARQAARSPGELKS